MSTRPGTGRRARRGAEEADMFDRRRAVAPGRGRAKLAKARASRRERRAARQGGWSG